MSAVMGFLRTCIQRYGVISWLLLAVLLLQLMFPLHFHLHHEVDAGEHGHAHVIDAHLPTDDALGHHLDEGAETFKVTPDIILKKNMDSSFGFALFACLIILLPAILAVRSRLWRASGDLHYHFLYYDLAPPLRAPPAS